MQCRDLMLANQRIEPSRLRSSVPVPPSLLIGWADHDHLIVRLELTMLVADLAGEVTWAYPMEVQSPEAAHVGSSDGFPREAARFTFGVDPD